MGAESPPAIRELVRELHLYERFVVEVEDDLPPLLKSLGDRANRRVHRDLLALHADALDAIESGNEARAREKIVEIGKRWRKIRTHTLTVVGQEWVKWAQQNTEIGTWIETKSERASKRLREQRDEAARAAAAVQTAFVAWQESNDGDDDHIMEAWRDLREAWRISLYSRVMPDPEDVAAAKPRASGTVIKAGGDVNIGLPPAHQPPVAILFRDAEEIAAKLRAVADELTVEQRTPVLESVEVIEDAAKEQSSSRLVKGISSLFGVMMDGGKALDSVAPYAKKAAELVQKLIEWGGRT